MSFEVVVVGGGPAGATAATILAQHGRKVLLLEKARFPRYHIGESMLPFSWYTFKRLGVLEKLEKTAHPRKHSVQFVRTNGEVSIPFYFESHRDHPSSVTWQVVRSEFDQLMLDNAREHGVEVREGIHVREPIIEDGVVKGVRATDEAGHVAEYRAPMTVDASGRDAVSMIRNGWRVPDPQLDKLAIWTYFRGAMRDSGIDEGATTVAYLPEKGWFWYIPLRDDVVSVGVVAEQKYLFRDGKDLPKIFAREVAANAWMARHLAPGTDLGPYRVTGEYSYRSRYCAQDGLVLVGDAFAFLDPLFSSGVLIAVKSGELAADAVHAALSAGDVSSSRFAAYGERICSGIESMRRLVCAFYEPGFSFSKIAKLGPEYRGWLTDCLIGNLEPDFTKLFDAVSEIAAMPDPVPHGGALVRPAKVA